MLPNKQLSIALPGPGVVDIWVLRVDDENTRAFNRLLTTEERHGVERYRKDCDRKRAIVGRAGCRALLARYFQCDPKIILFGTTSAGRPELIFPEASPLQFNVSHSGDYALVALACSDVGVDLEKCRKIPEAETIAQRVLSDKAWLAVLHAKDTSRTFLREWTRMEAYLKATGEGLSGLCRARIPDPDYVTVSFDVDANHVAAVCTRGRTCPMTSVRSVSLSYLLEQVVIDR